MIKFHTIAASIACMAVLGTSGVAHAAGQSSSTHNVIVETTVVSPLAATTGQVMKFGDIVPGASAGTVVLSTSNTRSVGTGGVTLASGSTTPASGVVNVSGTGNASFTIGFSSGVTLALDTDSTKSMTVDSFVLKVDSGTDQSSNYAGTLTSGAAALKIGGTLHVGTSTDNPAGDYSTAHTGGSPLTLTLTYD